MLDIKIRKIYLNVEAKITGDSGAYIEVKNQCMLVPWKNPSEFLLTETIHAELSALAGGLKIGKSQIKGWVRNWGGISGGWQEAGKVGILIGRLYFTVCFITVMLYQARHLASNWWYSVYDVVDGWGALWTPWSGERVTVGAGDTDQELAAAHLVPATQLPPPPPPQVDPG